MLQQQMVAMPYMLNYVVIELEYHFYILQFNNNNAVEYLSPIHTISVSCYFYKGCPSNRNAKGTHMP